jgi:formylglycine-generating enzyme required for sulfatase activity
MINVFAARRYVWIELFPALALGAALGIAAPHAGARDNDMVPLPGGAFMMGRDDGPADERPAHRVTLQAFAIDRRPVTNAEFAAFLDAIGTRNRSGQHLFDWDDEDARIRQRQGRWRADPGYERHPVVEMTWFGARDYCRAHGKRLPTEAEREYAARGVEGRTYPWGNDPPSRTRAQYAAGWGKTRPVGSFPDGATPEGVLDLAGNVHEWTSSIALAYPYRHDDGREDADKVADRVTRGGAADTGPETLRSTWRGATVSRRPTAGHHNIGFRCAQ